MAIYLICKAVLCKIIISYFRNPTPEEDVLLQNLSWPLVDSKNFAYVDINEDLEIKNHPKEETYSYWISLYEKLNYTDFDTF